MEKKDTEWIVIVLCVWPHEKHSELYTPYCISGHAIRLLKHSLRMIRCYCQYTAYSGDNFGAQYKTAHHSQENCENRKKNKICENIKFFLYSMHIKPSIWALGHCPYLYYFFFINILCLNLFVWIGWPFRLTFIFELFFERTTNHLAYKLAKHNIPDIVEEQTESMILGLCVETVSISNSLLDFWFPTTAIIQSSCNFCQKTVYDINFFGVHSVIGKMLSKTKNKKKIKIKNKNVEHRKSIHSLSSYRKILWIACADWVKILYQQRHTVIVFSFFEPDHNNS